MNCSRAYAVGLLFLVGVPSFGALATSPPIEPSDYSPSKRLIEASKQYDDCVRTTAREFSSAPDAIPLIVQKAERHCHFQLEQLQEQGRADSVDRVGKMSDLKRKVDLFVNKAIAGTRVSAFAEVATVRQPPIMVR